MKKVIFTLALLVQVGVAALADNKEMAVTYARYNNVKIFQQASTSTAVIETVNTTDKVEFIRKHNSNWAIVSVNGKAGYVLLSEINQLKTNKTR